MFVKSWLFTISLLLLCAFSLSMDVTAWHLCNSSEFISSQKPWSCPNGKVRLWPRNVCDGVRHCSSGMDENCVAFENSTVSSNDELDAIQLKFPNFGCALPVCYNADWTTPMLAHLFCKLMSQETYDAYGPISREQNSIQLAIEADAVRCQGGEPSLHRCLLHPLPLSDSCNFLGIRCKRQCSFVINETEGVVSSPGYPSYALPDLHCHWLFNASTPLTAYVFQFMDVNLYEFPQQQMHRGIDWYRQFRKMSRSSSGERPRFSGNSNFYGLWQQQCKNSLISMRLGRIRIPDGKIKFKVAVFCNRSVVMQNFTSTGPIVSLRYLSGAYLGSLTGAKGFQAKFWQISANSTSDYFFPDEPQLDDPMKGIATWLKIFMAVAAGLAIFLSCLVGCWLRNVYDDARRDLVRQLGVKPKAPRLSKAVRQRLAKNPTWAYVANVLGVNLTDSERKRNRSVDLGRIRLDSSALSRLQPEVIELVEAQLRRERFSRLGLPKFSRFRRHRSFRRQLRRVMSSPEIVRDKEHEDGYSVLEPVPSPYPVLRQADLPTRRMPGVNIHAPLFCQTCADRNMDSGEQCEHAQAMIQFLGSPYVKRRDANAPMARRVPRPSTIRSFSPPVRGARRRRSSDSSVSSTLPCNIRHASDGDSSDDVDNNNSRNIFAAVTENLSNLVARTFNSLRPSPTEDRAFNSNTPPVSENRQFLRVSPRFPFRPSHTSTRTNLASLTDAQRKERRRTSELFDMMQARATERSINNNNNNNNKTVAPLVDNLKRPSLVGARSISGPTILIETYND